MGPYSPQQYRIEVTQSGSVNVTVNLRVTPVVITSPSSGEVPAGQFAVSGTGGEYGVGTVTLHNSTGDALLGTATINVDGTWTASVTLPSDAQPLTFYAKQKIGTWFSSPSASVTVTLVLNAPAITAPAANSDQLGIFEVSGDLARTGAIVQVFNGQTEVGRTGVLTGATWRCSVTVPFGQVSLIAKQLLNNKVSPASAARVFNIRPNSPAITAPAANSLQLQSFTLSGNQGLSGAKVQVYQDLGPNKVGESAVLSGASWSASITVPVGLISLVVTQIQNGNESLRGTPRIFKIRPPKQTAVAVELLPSQAAKFSGTGYNGATLLLSYVSGPVNKSLPEVVVANGVWQVNSTGWTHGTYTYSATQKVSDNAGGWIPSEDFHFVFTIVPPELEPVPDPVPDRPTEYSYTPTFTGSGINGATVLIKKQGGAEAASDARVAGSRWSSQSSVEWGPTLSQNVDLKQRLDGRESQNWVRVVVKIPPLAPAITGLVDNELSPALSGTCWRSGAVVKLTFSDKPGTAETATVTGGTWTLRRSTPFAPNVPHTVTVTQTAAQQTSPPTTRTFEVRRTLLNPVITWPTSGIEVERDLTVRGRQGMAGASMQLRISGINAGAAKLLTSDGDWSIDLKGLAFGPGSVDARQTLDGRPSDLSDPVPFQVVLMPPVFTVPQPDGDLPRTSIISGEGTPGTTVEVWLDGSNEFVFRGVPVNADGHWQGSVTLPVGVTKLRARQAMGSEVSNDSPLLTCNVVPAAPYIETPVKDGLIGRLTVVSGFGEPGDTVTVLLGDAVLGSAPILTDRTWSVATVLTQPGGDYVLVAVASLDGFESDRSAQQSVVLGSYLPLIDSPQAGRWVSEPVAFSGQGRLGVGQLVSWFNPQQPWAPNLAVSAQGWQGLAVRALSAGGHWCRFQQTIDDGADGSTISDWSESGRFDVPGPSSR
ncbi:MULTISPECIES: hypothetical protein [unclassified Pseudomonas]|uniref:hypothetical protein n=1 Tax=unclassified Pseudomonas TaxID=196821 RepID=UPI002AC9C405|nr:MULTISPECIES: hypothetical protein [unclassified Pseudomonas]MEB0046401.1 hypothetical protein [Pseudomonas sp. Dout3]MEB0097674.1 hypothetical protein [Pseudomonas sp. DC1.2]WPX57737.1 hypothetical protein RHM68_19270 [Pseudomonas sp. DC1.2]